VLSRFTIANLYANTDEGRYMQLAAYTRE